MAAHEHLTDSCPSLQELLLAGTRELPDAELLRTDEHVAGCETCRRRVRRADALVEAYGALEMGKWPDSRSSATPAVLTLHRRRPLVRWVASAAAVAALILFLVITGDFNSQTVSAQGLLERAAAAELRASSRLEQIVRIRITPSAARRPPNGQQAFAPIDLQRRLTLGVATGSLDSELGQHEPSRRFAELVRTAGFDLRRPLDVTQVQAWRDRLARKRDTIVRSGDTIVLRTTTSESAVREAELTVHVQTFGVIALRLTFEEGLLEVTEIHRADAAAVANSVSSDATPMVPPEPEKPATVERAPAPPPTPVRPALNRWLAQQFNSSSDRRQFVDSLTVLVADVRQQLMDLQSLSSRYPAPGVGMNRPVDIDAAGLDRQVSEHVERARHDLVQLDQRFALMFGTHTLPRSRRQHGVPADWRGRVAIGLEHAVALDGLLNQLLAHDDLFPVDHPAGAKAFGATFDALWTVLNGADERPLDRSDPR